MKIKETFHKRQLAIAVILTAILVSSITFSATWLYAGGSISSPGTTYGPGDVDAYSFIIFEEGGTYYAKNCSTRLLDYSSTNASYVINSAIQALPSYDADVWSDSAGAIYIRAGNYSIDTSIVMKDGTYLLGEGIFNTILDSTINDGTPVITTEGVDGVTPQYAQKISELCINGHGAEGDGIYWEYSVRTSEIDNVWVRNVGGNGTHFYHCIGAQILDSYTSACGENGVSINYKSHGFSMFRVDSAGNTGYGLYHDGGSQFTLSGGYIQQNDAGDIYLRVGKGSSVDGVYMENSNAGVNQMTVNGTVFSYAIEISGCYFNGGTVANGIVIDNAYHTTVSTCHFESCVVGINITSNAYWTQLLNNRHSASPTVDNGVLTVRIDFGYVYLSHTTHPGVGGWGVTEQGRIWFCTTHNMTEYWNSTAIVTP